MRFIRVYKRLQRYLSLEIRYNHSLRFKEDILSVIVGFNMNKAIVSVCRLRLSLCVCVCVCVCVWKRESVCYPAISFPFIFINVLKKRSIMT